MKAPTASEAYAMIRVLKKRGAPGDGEKVAQLQAIIDEARDKAALLNVDKFFPKGK